MSETINGTNSVIIIRKFKGEDGFFIKSFFSDSSLNINGWLVTQQALERDLKTALDKNRYFGRTAPLILRDDFGHPDGMLPEQTMLETQEVNRIGDFIEVGIDSKTGKAYAVVRLNEDIGKTEQQKEKIRVAIEQIENGELNFVSPSLRPTREFLTDTGKNIITGFRVNHLAVVLEPAFGTFKAQIKGRCTGDPKTCLKALSSVQANKEIITCQECKDEIDNCTCPVNAPTQQAKQIQYSKCGDTGDLTITIPKNLIGTMPKNEQIEQFFTGTESLKPQVQSKELMANDSETPFDKMSEEEKEELVKEAQAARTAKSAVKAEKHEGENNNGTETETPKKDEAAENVLKEVEKTKDEVADLRATVDEEIKKPLAASIAEAKMSLGRIEEKDMQATIEGLMKQSTSSLKELKGDYSAMVEKSGNTEQPIEVKYQYQAAADGSDSKPGIRALNSIRGRMST